jgi:predicted unusual protein kinase regulating ubiquinone biosynthesis (AarF/ABC1/UbiB family)
MQNTSPTPSAKIFEPFTPPVVGGSDGAVATPAPARALEPRGVITRRAQVQRAYLITKLFIWFVVRARWLRWTTKDHDAAIRQEAVWLRHITERLGGTFVKLAQQASIRRDVLPEAYCNELAQLQDSVPPIPLGLMHQIIEDQVGRPVEEVFASIDPVAIGSASIGCVYKGQLLDGRDVAIKIRRPGIEQAFALDLAVMDRAVALLDLVGLSSMGLSKNMVEELRHVLAEELNFASEIRYQTLFRRNFKRWKRINITAPKVYHDCSGGNVIVTEFVQGIRLRDLLANLQAHGTAYARFLTRLGIDHRRIGQRLVQGQHFQVHECPFFHADPHPGNVVVQPGGKIVFLDFGACGVLSERDRNLVLEMNRRFAVGDVVGMVQCVTGIMEPLPRIDTDAFTGQLEKEWWQGYYGIIDKHALWHERTSFRLWTALLTTLRKSDIELPTRMLKLVRATLLYDTVAAQLDDKINVFKEFDKYAHASVKRQKKQLQKDLIRQGIQGPDDWVFQRYNQVEKIAGRVLYVAEKLLNEPNLRLDASFNILVGIITEAGAVVRTLIAMAVAFGLLVYSYDRYLRVYEPQNYLSGGDLSALPLRVFESMLNGSVSGFVMAAAVAMGLFLGALNLLAVYQRLKRLFGQHDKAPE